MATIEERAKNFIARRTIPKQAHQFAMKCYINGATEQRKIDIDKACEWFSEHLIEYTCYNEMDGWDINHNEMHEDFRKAMEDKK